MSTTNPIPPIETFDDLADDIVAYETGLLDDDACIGLFQRLIDSGLAWQLQGSYGRTAVALIECGACTPPATEVDERPVRPELIGTRCECGALYDTDRRGYSCAF